MVYYRMWLYQKCNKIIVICLILFTLMIFLVSIRKNSLTFYESDNYEMVLQDSSQTQMSNGQNRAFSVKDYVMSSFKLKQCECMRHVNISTAPTTPFSHTTCGQDAYLRGESQKVVGFSFYGTLNSIRAKKKGYYQGIKENLDLMPIHYPGWSMRLYYDLEENDTTHLALCDLACNNNILDLCYVRDLPGVPMRDASKIFAMNWRFFSTLDPQVDMFVCRDLDSRFSDREKEAVDEWMRSGKALHSMRDHPAHTTSMLGASWGANLKAGNSRAKWKKSWQKMLEDPMTYAPRGEVGPDQMILTKYIWVWAQSKSYNMQHDAYTCAMFPGSIGWPTQRRNEPNNFVASVFIDNDSLWKMCPKRCRRKGHPEWTHC